MKRELEQQLAERFPSLFRDLGGDPRVTGLTRIELPDEWHPLVERMCEELTPYRLKFTQLKVKFGELRVYFRCDEGQDWQAVAKVTDQFEAESHQAHWQSALKDSLSDIQIRIAQHTTVNPLEE